MIAPVIGTHINKNMAAVKAQKPKGVALGYDNSLKKCASPLETLTKELLAGYSTLWDRAFTHTRLVTKGVSKNFFEVNPGKFYTGPFPGKKGIKDLAEEGMGIIINFRHDTRKNVEKYTKIATENGIEYYNIPINPFSGPARGDINEFFEILNKGEREGKKVFAHCMHGQDRAGFFRAIYRVAKQGWEPDRAVVEWENNGYRKKLFPELKKIFNELTSVGLDIAA